MAKPAALVGLSGAAPNYPAPTGFVSSAG